MPRPLLIGLVVLIATAWAVNLVVDYTTGRGEPSVNAIFGIVVGALFALGRKEKQSRQVRKKIADLIAPDDRGDRP